MNPIVPVMMAVGAVIFFTGLSALIHLNFKKTKTINFFGKAYSPWRFIVTTILSGVGLIMVSIYLNKLFPPDIEVIAERHSITLSSNLRYELSSILPANGNNEKIMSAINRFQKEYQDALSKGEKNTMELLILEMSFLIRTELEKQNYPSHRIGSEVERVMQFLKQKPD
ncbi:MAG: hypothetical protein KF908_03440 [Nitrosomonas sp.]|nr:hypothetical protein [Nitrosomonas sp.]MCW5608577.1 hypothetical protein [Nitrosomonas sp.]